MEAEISPLQRAFNSFLMTMPLQQLEELLKYLQDARAHENNLESHLNEQVQSSPRARSDNRRGSVVPSGTSSRSSTSRGRQSQDAKKRPLNSFIAFRSYYSVIFPELTQKSKSGILRFLWQNDPFKAKWAILAKAYSIVRDDHDGEVSLDSFLSLNARFIGILEPTRYLEVMGWQLEVDDQQQYTMARVKITTANEAETSTNYSVNDIVKNCYSTGYVSEENRRARSTQGGNASVMAFAAQPTLVVHQNNSIQLSANRTILTETPRESPATMTTPDSQADSTSSPNTSDMNIAFDETSVETLSVPGVDNVQDLPQFAHLPDGFYPFEFDLNGFDLHNWDQEGGGMFHYDPTDQTPVMQHDTFVPGPYEVIDIDSYLEN